MHRHMLQVGIYIHMPYIYICRQRGVQCVCHKLHIIMCIHTYTCYRWLAAQLFGSVQLIPVRRPHASDEVVANLAKYPYP